MTIKINIWAVQTQSFDNPGISYYYGEVVSPGEYWDLNANGESAEDIQEQLIRLLKDAKVGKKKLKKVEVNIK